MDSNNNENLDTFSNTSVLELLAKLISENEKLKQENKILKSSESKQENDKVFAFLSSIQAASNLTMIWDQEKIPLNTTHFKKENNGEKIVFRTEGVYRIDVVVLSLAGTPCYPYIQVNSTPIMYGYASSQHGQYSAANLNIIWPFKKGDSLMVGFQKSGADVFVGSTAVYHSLIIQKI